ncbi:MAG: Gx transporter family protein [Gammaproteobacteria bacterium]|nr:Gx transporter family protein [Gammaproteobacteria bacterium]MDH3559723.1 Gx transporter family protein [Gammaproteobacteria bacterium]
MQIQTTAEDQRIAWLAALAITIHILESAFPSPLPGIKPGLANVITIVVLIQFGWRSAAWVSLLRVLCGSLLLGTFLTPTFLLSLSGAVCSIGILWLAGRLPGRGFGPVGFSLLAALAHTAGQFTIAWLLFIPHPALWRLFPVLLTAALLFGTVSGIIAGEISNRQRQCTT